MQNGINKKLWDSAVLTAIITGFLYFNAYVTQATIFQYYRVPLQFITIDLSAVLDYSNSVFVYLVMLFFCGIAAFVVFKTVFNLNPSNSSSFIVLFYCVPILIFFVTIYLLTLK